MFIKQIKTYPISANQLLRRIKAKIKDNKKLWFMTTVTVSRSSIYNRFYYKPNWNNINFSIYFILPFMYVTHKLKNLLAKNNLLDRLKNLLPLKRHLLLDYFYITFGRNCRQQLSVKITILQIFGKDIIFKYTIHQISASCETIFDDCQTDKRPKLYPYKDQRLGKMRRNINTRVQTASVGQWRVTSQRAKYSK